MSTTTIEHRRQGAIPYNGSDPGPSIGERIRSLTGAGGSGGDQPGDEPREDELTKPRLLRFGAIIGGLIVVSLLVAVWTSRSQLDDFHVAVDNADMNAQLEAATVDIEQVRSAILNGLFLGTIGLETDAAEAFEVIGSELDQAAERVARVRENATEPPVPEVLEEVERLEAALAVYDDVARAVGEPTTGGSIGSIDPDELAEASAEFQTAYDNVRAEVDATLALVDSELEHEEDVTRSNASRGQLMILLASVVALGAFGFIGRKVLRAVLQMREMQDELEISREREREQAADLEHKVDQMLTVIAAAADGDLTQPVTVSGADAIGQMGDALSRLLGNFRASVAGLATNAEALAAAAEELQVVSEQMGANAAETSSQVSLVTEGSVEVSRNVETVSTGAEEMSASIKEIAKNAADAAKVAEQAVEAAASTNATVEKLGESSAEIGQIVKVITGIAQQTNLLALNATIEAARAGEAGKGFAVVANEVKELAKETAKATEDISLKIETIQGDTGRSVEAISEIATIISQISEFQTTIASAVEEQAATTSDIARSVNDASRGSTEITSNMQAVASAAESTSSGAADSQRAATELAHMASELQSLVGRFTY